MWRGMKIARRTWERTLDLLSGSMLCAIKESTEAHEGARRQTSLHNVNCISFERGKIEERCECSSENG